MTEMTCDQVVEASAEYALDILPPGEAVAVSAHLLRCPACRAEVEHIRKIGDRLCDLVPDAEPPLGFDQRVLSAVSAQPARRTAKLHLLLTTVAAAVIIVAAITASVTIIDHHSGRPNELTAVLREGDRPVGSISIGGHPTWISMTVSNLPLTTGTVSCQLITGEGSVTNIVTFQLVDGSGSWGAPEPDGAPRPATARLVTPSGNVLAVGSFPSP